jgi:tRNA(adenine34) deaminase
LHPSALLRDDAYFMHAAYNESLKGWRANEVPIGAVIVINGEIVARAHNQVEALNDPTAHAEILAMTAASRFVNDWRLAGATLYVTKEPCPMCAGASIMARLDAVVYAWGDPKMGCMGGATALHELPRLNHRVAVRSGVMEDACRTVLQTYFQIKRTDS